MRMSYTDRILVAEKPSGTDGHNVRSLRPTVLDRLEQRPSTGPSLCFLFGPYKKPAHRIAHALLNRPSKFLPKCVGQQPVRSLEVSFRGVG